jgi:selenide,water dikinase
LASVKLTEFSHCAGCASKISQTDLESILLPRLIPLAHPNVLVGTEVPDDAGIYKISDELALVLTVDFFTPIVNDPRSFGAIAATNAISDVYAMGGTPIAALNIVAFPAASETLPLSVLGDILEGGEAKAREAGVVVIGGHTVDDAEPKYGLAVVGTVHPERVATKGGAKLGDRLVLSKPIGTGVMTTALKRGLIGEDGIADAVRVMSTLNRDACRAMNEVGVNAATDVTGFGLLGHLHQMLRVDGLGARIAAREVPLLDGARELAAKGAIAGGSKKNAAAAAAHTRFANGIAEADRTLLADAQTSGGLLMAVAPEKADALVARLRELGYGPSLFRWNESRRRFPGRASDLRTRPGPLSPLSVERRSQAASSPSASSREASAIVNWTASS